MKALLVKSCFTPAQLMPYNTRRRLCLGPAGSGTTRTICLCSRGQKLEHRGVRFYCLQPPEYRAVEGHGLVLGAAQLPFVYDTVCDSATLWGKQTPDAAQGVNLIGTETAVGKSSQCWQTGSGADVQPQSPVRDWSTPSSSSAVSAAGLDFSV